MPDQADKWAQFRRDVITALTKLQTEISALEHVAIAVLPEKDRQLEAYRSLAKHDVQMFRDYFERHLQQIP